MTTSLKSSCYTLWSHRTISNNHQEHELNIIIEEMKQLPCSREHGLDVAFSRTRINGK